MNKQTAQNGKGSSRRTEAEDSYRDNWDRIFGNKETTKVSSVSGHLTENNWVAITNLNQEQEESAEDRFERHMAPIRKLQKEKTPTANFPPFDNV
tara:strand:- start:528 stop:812 length:285 start_codon:yes stop_codon:yes gene_type:complete